MPAIASIAAPTSAFTSSETPLAPNRHIRPVNSMPSTPCSENVGSSGAIGSRSAPADANARMSASKPGIVFTPPNTASTDCDTSAARAFEPPLKGTFLCLMPWLSKKTWPIVACIVAAPDVPHVISSPDAFALSMNSCMLCAGFDECTCSDVTSCDAQPRFSKSAGIW